jgi:predicted dinucleotide-binding enzyme
MIQRIGIIGTGMIGSALARLSVRAGYRVVLSNSKGPASLTDLVGELGSLAFAATVNEAAAKGDIVIATIPIGLYENLPAETLKGKIVIDTMNYYPSRDNHIEVLDKAELTSSELIQQHLKDSRVVKALFNLDFHHLFTNARPHGDTHRTTLPIAGNNVEAKKIVADFMDAIGYDSIDTGSLTESWRIEPGTPIYVWPYVPEIPEGLTKEDAKKYYLETSGKPVSADKAKELVAKAERRFPIGGFPEVLPPIHLELLAEIYRNRK